jgi:Bacterial conjugation TrbI-like protein
MQRILIGIVSFALTAGVALAQSSSTSSSSMSQSPAAQSQGQQMPASQGTPATQPNTAPGTTSAHSGPAARIAPGSVIPVALTKTVDAKKAKVGDEVVAKVTQDMKSNSGEVIVAKDTKMMGRVTQAQARNKEQKESEVAIAFDRAVMKDGSTMSMPMSIQAVIGPQNNNPQGNQNNAPAAPEPTGPTASTGSSRPGMGGSSPAPSTSGSPETPNNTANNPQANATSRPPITANTQGVIGISNLTLDSTAENPTQGSMLTSDKNNVKIESGTLLLLKVNR